MHFVFYVDFEGAARFQVTRYLLLQYFQATRGHLVLIVTVERIFGDLLPYGIQTFMYSLRRGVYFRAVKLQIYILHVYELNEEFVQ